MTYKIKTHFWSGNVTIKAKDLDVLYRVQGHYEAIVYDVVPNKKGCQVRVPFFNGGFEMRLSKPKGALEERLDAQRRGEHI